MKMVELEEVRIQPAQHSTDQLTNLHPQHGVDLSRKLKSAMGR
jgi:hypothetical protein